jgi:hypothetical protein
VSVYRSKKSPFYWYDFQISGQRFHGLTRSTNRKEAEKVEQAEREKAKAAIKASSRLAGSLQIVNVAARYWEIVGKHHAGAGTTEHDLNRHVRRREDRQAARRDSGPALPGHIVRREDALATAEGCCRREGFPLSRLSPRLRDEAVAPDWFSSW